MQVTNFREELTEVAQVLTGLRDEVTEAAEPLERQHAHKGDGQGLVSSTGPGAGRGLGWEASGEGRQGADEEARKAQHKLDMKIWQQVNTRRFAVITGGRLPVLGDSQGKSRWPPCKKLWGTVHTSPTK